MLFTNLQGHRVVATRLAKQRHPTNVPPDQKIAKKAPPFAWVATERHGRQHSVVPEVSAIKCNTGHCSTPRPKAMGESIEERANGSLEKQQVWTSEQVSPSGVLIGGRGKQTTFASNVHRSTTIAKKKGAERKPNVQLKAHIWIHLPKIQTELVLNGALPLFNRATFDLEEVR